MRTRRRPQVQLRRAERVRQLLSLYSVCFIRFYVFTLLCRGQEAVADEEDQEAVCGGEPKPREEAERGERGLGEGEVPAQREQDQQLHQHQEQQHIHRRRGPLARQVSRVLHSTHPTSIRGRIVWVKSPVVLYLLRRQEHAFFDHVERYRTGSGSLGAKPAKAVPLSSPKQFKRPKHSSPEGQENADGVYKCTSKNLSTS